MPKRKLTYKDFKRYFSNNLQNKEKYAFEKKMMQDAFEEEAYDGLSTLSEKELEQDIAELKSGINLKTKKNRKLVPVWYRYAAGIIILIGVGATLFVLNNHFWQDSMLKKQFSEGLEIADSIMLEIEKEIHQLEGNNKTDTSKHILEELIADNKKFVERKPEEKLERNINSGAGTFVSETDNAVEDDPVPEMLEIEGQAEIVVDETIPEPGKVIEEKAIVEALQEKTEGLIVEKSSESLNRKFRKTTLGYLTNQDKMVTGKRIIKGKIVGADDELSIPGVSVVLEGNTSIGTTTNIDGEFTLTIPGDDKELKNLIAMFVGMKPQTISLKNDTNLMVYMEADAMELDEVVVVAYEKTEKEYTEPIKISAKPPYPYNKKKFKEHILNNINYTLLAGFPGVHKIKFTFTVKANGSLSDFEFLQSPNIVFNREIERILRKSGNWSPATTDKLSRKSTVKMTLKIDVK